MRKIHTALKNMSMYSYIIEAGGNRVGWVDGINNEQRRFAMGEGRVCWSWVVYPHSLPSPALLCPLSLATCPCGLACQLPLLLAPRWVPNVGDTSKRVGIREKPGVAPPLSPVTILGVAASQPWLHLPPGKPATVQLLPTPWPQPMSPPSVPPIAFCWLCFRLLHTSTWSSIHQVTNPWIKFPLL